MFLLLSGEGTTDMGACNTTTSRCEGADFIPGSMAWMVNQLVEQVQGYDFSCLENGFVEYVSEKYLADGASDLKALRKSPSLPGMKKKKETLYFRRNARVLARRAKEKATECNDDVIAILFRDSDGSVSAGRGEWQDKWDSMINGFDDEKFSRGVPMIPKPKSEAWLLCAVDKNYQHCAALESTSGNDNAPNSLKTQLGNVLGGEVSAQSLADKVTNRVVDAGRIDMPSFNKFKHRLAEVVREVVGGPPE